VLMPDCLPNDSMVTGDRIRRSVLDAAIPHDARPSPPPFVTLSGGVTCWTPGSPLSAREVIEQADEALFRAKAAARNRIEAAPSLEGQLQATAAVG
ncbi:MAG: GGDEF domain-containing protein, partial [Thermoplasmata archaeon]|nr:GGDEF domain-containing protein [Thermoplasmata archaeon]